MPVIKKHLSGRSHPVDYTKEQLTEHRALQARRALQRGFSVEENFIRVKRHIKERSAALAFLTGIDLKPVQHIFNTIWPVPTETTDNKEK